MTAAQLTEKYSLNVICMPSPERTVCGGYAGDLLSWVMGRAQQNNVWFTIMTNLNIVAVASLSEVSLIVLAEGVKPDSEVIETALQKGVNIVSAPLSAYDIAVKMSADL